MRRRGYTFIELMISSAILAGVLITSFTVYAVINRNGRNAQRFRSNSYDGSTLVGIVTDYGRYASPWLNANDEPVCTSGLSSVKQEALQKGLAREGTNTIWWFAVRESDAVGVTSGYLLYSFVFTNTGAVATTLGSLPSYNPTFTSEKITEMNPGSGSGICKSTPQVSGLSLLPTDLRVVSNPSTEIINITTASTTAGGLIGPISLNVSQNRRPHLVEVSLGIINLNTPNQAPFQYKTSFTPRDYASEFVAL